MAVLGETDRSALAKARACASDQNSFLAHMTCFLVYAIRFSSRTEIYGGGLHLGMARAPSNTVKKHAFYLDTRRSDRSHCCRVKTRKCLQLGPNPQAQIHTIARKSVYLATPHAPEGAETLIASDLQVNYIYQALYDVMALEGPREGIDIVRSLGCFTGSSRAAACGYSTRARMERNKVCKGSTYGDSSGRSYHSSMSTRWPMDSLASYPAH